MICKIKKDAFYVYKAYWSKEPFIHIASKRFINRTGNKATITVYTNQKEVTLIHNDNKITKKGDKIFKFKIKLDKENYITAISNDLKDTSYIKKVDELDQNYINTTGNSHSWEKKDKDL